MTQRWKLTGRSRRISADKARRLPPARTGEGLGEAESDRAAGSSAAAARRDQAEARLALVYERWKAPLEGFARRALGLDAALAEDVAEDALVDYLARPGYVEKPEREAYPLLCAMARNRARDLGRRASRETPMSDVLPSLTEPARAPETASNTPSPFAELLRSETRERGRDLWRELCGELADARGRLRKSQAAALDAHLSTGDKHSVVAARLGLTEIAYTLRITRAAHRVYELLGERWKLRLAGFCDHGITHGIAASRDERVHQRLLWLVARQARGHLKRELGGDVEARIAALDPSRRAALSAWMWTRELGGLDGDSRSAAWSGLRAVGRALCTERPEFAWLCVATFAGWKAGSQRNRRAEPARGSSADSALVVWCLEHLVPDLRNHHDAGVGHEAREAR